MLLDVISSAPQYRILLSAMAKRGWPTQMTGLSHIHKAAVAAALSETGPFVVVAPDEAAATRLCEDINAFVKEERAFLYPAREWVFRDVEGVSREYEFARLKVLDGLVQGRISMVICSIEALLQYTLPPQVLKKNILKLCPGQTHSIEDLCARLLHAGYERRDQVDGVCQFSQRGGILDFYPP